MAVSTLSYRTVQVVDLLKVLNHLVNIRNLIDNILAFHAVFIELCNNIRCEPVELLCSERKHGQFFERDSMVQEVVPGPSNQLESVHSGHVVINNHQCDTILFPFHMQRSDGFCNLQPILKELCLVFELHLVV